MPELFVPTFLPTFVHWIPSLSSTQRLYICQLCLPSLSRFFFLSFIESFPLPHKHIELPLILKQKPPWPLNIAPAPTQCTCLPFIKTVFNRTHFLFNRLQSDFVSTTPSKQSLQGHQSSPSCQIWSDSSILIIFTLAAAFHMINYTPTCKTLYLA